MFDEKVGCLTENSKTNRITVRLDVKCEDGLKNVVMRMEKIRRKQERWYKKIECCLTINHNNTL